MIQFYHKSNSYNTSNLLLYGKQGLVVQIKGWYQISHFCCEKKTFTAYKFLMPLMILAVFTYYDLTETSTFPEIHILDEIMWRFLVSVSSQT